MQDGWKAPRSSFAGPTFFLVRELASAGAKKPLSPRWTLAALLLA